VLGGRQALPVVTKLVASQNAELQANAIRALGNLAGLCGAAKTLLAIAGNSETKEAQYISPLQGVVRLVKSVENERPHRA